MFKQVNYSLSKLIQDIEIGEIGLPDIQRPFVWTSIKVRDLFDSMYKGFPVGYLLFWSNAVSGMNRVIGTDTKQKTIPRLLIVDGQQRLTSLYAVLKNISVKRHDYTDQRITIAFRPKGGQFVLKFVFYSIIAMYDSSIGCAYYLLSSIQPVLLLNTRAVSGSKS